MADREKVIGLECCKNGFCHFCPYNDGVDLTVIKCKNAMMLDALDLLKPEKPEMRTITGLSASFQVPHCPKCHKHFFRRQNFCDQCGQAVMWE